MRGNARRFCANSYASHNTKWRQGTFEQKAGRRTQVSGAPDEDAFLMLRYAKGEASAFDTLYERNRAGLWRYFRRQLRDPDVAADVFQETWSRVIANRKSYQPSARFTTWLYRIAHNCCVDHWRKSGRLARREVMDADSLIDSADDPAPGPQALAMQAEAAAALEAALARLPEEQRSVFLLYVEGGMTIAEIAETTGVAAEAAKSRLRYAVAKLKETLGAAAPE